MHDMTMDARILEATLDHSFCDISLQWNIHGAFKHVNINGHICLEHNLTAVQLYRSLLKVKSFR